jgi:hypothetical protein
MPHPTRKSWTSEDVARLMELADSGATVLRAAAALGRRAHSIQKKARELGKPLRGVRIVKSELRKATADSVDLPVFSKRRFSRFDEPY